MEEIRQRRQQEWEAGAPAREEERQRKDAAQAARTEQKLLDRANKIAAKAWELMKDDKNCDKVVQLYTQALALSDWRQWRINRATCMNTAHNYDQAYEQWESLISDPQTPDDLIWKMRMAEWDIMYKKGYVCPVPPIFNGLMGCTGRRDKQHLDTIYVPLPYVQGRDWHAKNVLSSGPFTVTTKEGFTYRSGEVNMTTLPLMNARIQTGKKTVVRFILPDDTAFTIGPEADMTIDDFVYDPNENLTKMTANVIKGIFRFVTAKVARANPELAPSREIQLAVGCLCIRGTDVEIEHDPNGKGTQQEGTDRWWVCAYDGDVNIGDIHVPVGKCYFKFGPAEGYPVTFANQASDVDLSPNWDRIPGAGATDIAKNSQLSATDPWDKEIKPEIIGRQ